jgi:pimeloyl-ACP methyl ester carboxylesterase
MHPREVSALGVVAAPHPRAMLRGLRRQPGAPALRHVLAMQVPFRPERRLARADTGFLRDHLRSWSSAASAFPDDEALTTYQRAISQWPSSHCALEYHRWLVRSQVRADGRSFERAMRSPVGQPVLVVRGADDRTLPRGAFDATRAHVLGPVSEHVVAGAGHFVPEEAPEAVTALLLDWLSQR